MSAKLVGRHMPPHVCNPGWTTEWHQHDESYDDTAGGSLMCCVTKRMFPDQDGYEMAIQRDPDPIGTVRECDECGETWVAYIPDYGKVIVFSPSWRPETDQEKRSRLGLPPKRKFRFLATLTHRICI